MDFSCFRVQSEYGCVLDDAPHVLPSKTRKKIRYVLGCILDDAPHVLPSKAVDKI